MNMMSLKNNRKAFVHLGNTTDGSSNKNDDATGYHHVRMSYSSSGLQLVLVLVLANVNLLLAAAAGVVVVAVVVVVLDEELAVGAGGVDV